MRAIFTLLAVICFCAAIPAMVSVVMAVLFAVRPRGAFYTLGYHLRQIGLAVLGLFACLSVAGWLTDLAAGAPR